jgi:hypothetical protein
MSFQVTYPSGGELDKVRQVNYIDKIKNFAYLTQPYNKMIMTNIPAMLAIFDLDYESPDEETELLSIVVTCSGYGENDYYNLYVNDELWFDTWFPTEVKEGLYLGTSTYVYVLPPKSKIKLKFVNASGTAKKLWLGVRLLRNPSKEKQITVDFIDTFKVSEPTDVIINY